MVLFQRCGLLVKRYDNDKLITYKCINIALEREEKYFIRIKDYAIAEETGEVVGMYHSHGKGTNNFSNADKRCSDLLEMMQVLYIVETDKFYTYEPVIENEPVS